jgi:hypothetical protein
MLRTRELFQNCAEIPRAPFATLSPLFETAAKEQLKKLLVTVRMSFITTDNLNKQAMTEF